MVATKNLQDYVTYVIGTRSASGRPRRATFTATFDVLYKVGGGSLSNTSTSSRPSQRSFNGLPRKQKRSPAAVLAGYWSARICLDPEPSPGEERKVCHAVRMARAKGSPRLTNAKLNEMRRKGDPVADLAVKAVFDRGGVNAVNAMMQKLVRAHQPVPAELPEEVQDYLKETLQLPEWADMRKIERGQQLFETFGSRSRCACSARRSRRRTRQPMA